MSDDCDVAFSSNTESARKKSFLASGSIKTILPIVSWVSGREKCKEEK